MKRVRCESKTAAEVIKKVLLTLPYFTENSRRNNDLEAIGVSKQ
jgi:hypothetical protein